MSKLYLFAIGGTGSRVVKSLIMLLSAGVELNASEIKLMIIDPDTGGGDVSRTEHILEAYQRVHRDIAVQAKGYTNRFCKMSIASMLPDGFHVSGVDELNERGNPPRYSASELPFSQAFHENAMEDQDKALFEAFYSDTDRNDTLTVGSKGRQHIGTLGIVKFLNSPGFKEVFRDFQPQDRIFIISSVFGGTGASGFPVLLKKIKAGVAEREDYTEAVKGALKGAILILPYFRLKAHSESKGLIDGSTFNQKVVATLSYYKDNLDGLNRLYYLADRHLLPNYENFDGGSKQRNPTHLVELLAATAVIDFMGKEEMPLRTQYLEYGMSREIDAVLDFQDLGIRTRRNIAKPLTQFLLMTQYFGFDQYNRDPAWAKTRDLGKVFDSEFYVGGLAILKQYYLEWLTEMKDNTRSFAPFNLSPLSDKPFDMVTGIPTTGADLEGFRTTLARAVDKISFDGGLNLAFLELFWHATSDMVDGKKAPKVIFPY